MQFVWFCHFLLTFSCFDVFFNVLFQISFIPASFACSVCRLASAALKSGCQKHSYRNQGSFYCLSTFCLDVDAGKLGSYRHARIKRLLNSIALKFSFETEIDDWRKPARIITPVSSMTDGGRLDRISDSNSLRKFANSSGVRSELVGGE